eukprot:SAG31_NODE_1413_length_8459_cov_7.720215_13_plen_51_part_00
MPGGFSGTVRRARAAPPRARRHSGSGMHDPAFIDRRYIEAAGRAARGTIR